MSVPIEPAPYDLVVESDAGLKRVQVKTTRFRTQGGRYVTKLTRVVYDANATPNSGGKYRQARYQPGVVDLFFVVVANGMQYLIPYEVVAGRASVVLDDKYSAFSV